ncbi:DNA methyltransferase [Plantactinospora sp. ZYX-F-223]|uniref:site-specific DNA-methyltransferase n=1 Tax=Plantactinospora sp. ZYX-F-223 TaxID=3144103 RepID=UPI0031FC746D
MSRLSELLRQVALKDERLAADLKRETDALAERRAFGLNFERHVPEAVELPGRPVRKNDKVRRLPPRGETPTAENQILWRVASVDRKAGTATLTRSVVVAGGASVETTEAAMDDLVVVAEFRDPIYPGLISTGKVERGEAEKPYHAVINAENYHALQALLFTHRGKVDAIYIDPPYNTGARDWKYNNNYVEGDDLYRHSKWLAFMERRLILAKELLNPDSSVLIVTIDEKEYLRLGLLLEQVFPGAVRQMVTVVINPLGQARKQELARVEEYAYFVFLGSAGPTPTADDLLTERAATDATQSVRWERLLRGGTNARRMDRPNLFYPIVVDPATKRIVEVGEPIPREAKRDSVPDRKGLVTVWPLNTNGNEGRWRVSADAFRAMVARGYAKVGSYDAKNDRFSISYLGRAQVARIDSGEIKIIGRDENDVVVVEGDGSSAASLVAKTVWNRMSHRAGEHGSGLLKKLLPGRDFPFPKSLYSVVDALRIAVGNRPDALVVDYFAGSATTAHALMLLNREDGGSRRSIMVTNNEVSASEQATLLARGLRPGDSDWEALGICEYITKPRLVAAVTGRTPEGASVAGDYRFLNGLPISGGLEENVEFFTLTYEAPLRVSTNREFGKIAPFLWLNAGSRGRRIDDISTGWDVAEAYGVIADLDQSEQFLKAMEDAPSVTHAFIVTDEDRLFEAMVRRLPAHVEPVRLYEAYLRNFEIEAGRAAR